MSRSETLGEQTQAPNPAAQDRRLFRRYELGLEATLTTETGERHACAITDLSLGGAALNSGQPEWSDMMVQLEWNDLDCDGGVSAKVVRSTGERTHLAFVLDDQQESALTMFLVMSPATR